MQSTVDKVTPGLPVAVPTLPEVVGSLPVPELPVELPAVETVVEGLPTVTVALPEAVPVQPVKLDPSELLP